eukprot:774542-Amphidinium_carterae.1
MRAVLPGRVEYSRAVHDHLVMKRGLIAFAGASASFAALCRDDPSNWVDRDGYGCAAYTENQWCNDGTHGPGWQETWGSLSSYAVDGVDA